jgi:hypothetical protein
VLLFDLVPDAATSGANTVDHVTALTPPMARRPQLGHLATQLAASLAPVAILPIAFAAVGDRLTRTSIGGVGLTAIIIAIAVVTPLLSQTVSAGMYAALHDVDYSDRATVSSAILRALPRGLLLAVPFAAITGVGLASFRSWSFAVAATMATSLLLNLLMAMVLVVAFATRSAVDAVLAWTLYGVALVLAPASAWWLPPLVATLALLTISWGRARNATVTAPTPTLQRMAATLPRGLADAVPMWAIPPTLWFLDPEHFHAFLVFAGLIPAAIGYQTFFALFSARLWQAVDRVQRALSSLGYAKVVQTEIAETIREARRASISILVVNATVAAAAIMVWRLLGGVAWQRGPLIVLAASAASTTATLSYQYSIISSRAFVRRAAITLGALAIFAIIVALPAAVYLWGCVAASAVLSTLLLGANRNNWLQPEYNLFWSRAVTL